MKHKKLSVVYLFAFAITIGVVIIGFLFLFTGKLKKAKFYYPDISYTRLMSEARYIDYDLSMEMYEVELVKEYLLGPLDYYLRLNIGGDILAKNVWLVESSKDKGKQIIVINFDKSLSVVTKEYNWNFEWMIDGLLRTLKENTRVRSVFILEEGRRKKINVGKWNLLYPISFK